jgi:hypothetical protein
MVIHHNPRVHASRIISLGMAKGIVMELMKNKKMNRAMYVEWTNQEQQWQTTSINEMMSDEKGDNVANQPVDEKNLVGSGSCMILLC